MDMEVVSNNSRLEYKQLQMSLNTSHSKTDCSAEVQRKLLYSLILIFF